MGFASGSGVGFGTANQQFQINGCVLNLLAGVVLAGGAEIGRGTPPCFFGLRGEHTQCELIVLSVGFFLLASLPVRATILSVVTVPPAPSSLLQLKVGGGGVELPTLC